jgi:hypothetical protein
MNRTAAWGAALTTAIALGMSAPVAQAQAVNDQTVVVGKAALNPGEAAILARLNVWMDKYDHDPRSMCQDVYAEDANVWVPNNGYWYRNRATWMNYEVANFARQKTPRNSHLKLAMVRDNIAVIEAGGWAATLYFQPSDQRIFTDRTYIPGRANPPPAADLDAAPLISAGSLPPAIPDKTNLRYGAVEDRAGMKFGHMRTRAMGEKVFGAGSLTDEETRNVEAVRKLAALYNTASDKLVDQVYAPAFQRVLIKGGGNQTMHDKKALSALEAGIHKTFPGARMQITTIVPRGDKVAFETATSFTKDHEEWSLTVATFSKGRIVEEHIYESTAFDPASSLGKLVTQAAS